MQYNEEEAEWMPILKKASLFDAFVEYNIQYSLQYSTHYNLKFVVLYSLHESVH